MSFTPAGISLTSSKADDFYLMYFETLENEHLRYRLHLKDQTDTVGNNHDLILVKHLKDAKIKTAIFDFPLSKSLCMNCTLVCPGSELCPQTPIEQVRNIINDLLEEDARLYKLNPKKYEVDRKVDDLFELNTDLLAKRTDEHVLSKAFKRRLKRGLSPYANRPLDFWVWQHYYDAYLAVFQSSFDSFGDVSFIHLAYYEYWQKHLPKEISILETSPQLALLELYRAEIIEKKQLLTLMDINQAPLARLEIVRALTHRLHLIITEMQYDKLVRNPRAFSSFLLAIAGLKLESKNYYDLPQYTEPDKTRFFVPYFLDRS
jgi:hypothetical protein